MMHKIVIVDDEMLVRVGIKTIIPWEEHGFVIAGEASDGEQAVELCREVKPDIAMVDIKMPHMDGLSFIRSIKEVLPDLKVIFLSCYDDFSYVREALKLGATDYILKPSMSPAGLLEVLEKLKRQIETEKSSINEVSNLKAQIEKSKSLLKTNLLRDLLFNNNYSEAEAAEKIRGFNRDLSNQNLYVYILRVDNLAVSANYRTEHDISVLYLGIGNIIQEVSTSYPNIEAINNENREFVFIASYAHEVGEEKIRSQITGFCSKLHSLVTKYLNITVSIGISRMNAGYANLGKAYGEAEDSLGVRFYRGPGTTAFYGRHTVSYKIADFSAMFENLPVQKSIESGDPYPLYTDMERIFAVLRECPAVKARQVCIQLLNHIGREYSYINNEVQKILEQYDSYGMILKLDTLEQITELIYKVVKEFAVPSGQTCNYSSIVNKARLYVKQHYAEDIGLGKVSEQLNISKNYFCQLFKNETGENFISYLNRFRLEKAKEFLLKSDIKIYEIAEKAGIPNTRHFSKLFRDMTGVLPMEYRRKYSGLMIESNS